MDLLSLLVTHSTAKHKRDIFLKLKQPQPEPDLLIKDKSSAIVSNGLLSHHINIDPNMKKWIEWFGDFLVLPCQNHSRTVLPDAPLMVYRFPSIHAAVVRKL